MLSPHRHSWHSVIGGLLSPCVLRRQCSERKVVVCSFHTSYTARITGPFLVFVLPLTILCRALCFPSNLADVLLVSIQQSSLGTSCDYMCRTTFTGKGQRWNEDRLVADATPCIDGEMGPRVAWSMLRESCAYSKKVSCAVRLVAWSRSLEEVPQHDVGGRDLSGDKTCARRK